MVDEILSFFIIYIRINGLIEFVLLSNLHPPKSKPYKFSLDLSTNYKWGLGIV